MHPLFFPPPQGDLTPPRTCANASHSQLKGKKKCRPDSLDLSYQDGTCLWLFVGRVGLNMSSDYLPPVVITLPVELGVVVMVPTEMLR
jgi:hypothetical protein